jgi:HK97 family phage major capsid protein
MELNHEQIEDLSYLTREAVELSRKSNRTRQDIQREATLVGAMAAVKAGASLRDMQIDQANAHLQKAGLPTIKRSRMTLEQQYQARAWKHLVETRTDTGMTEGAPMLTHIGAYTGLGYFVPNGWNEAVYSAMAAHDVLFNEDDCTVIRTDNGRPLPIPVLGDIEKVASVVGESSSRTISSISDINHAKLGVYTYDSGRWPVSIEAVQDLQGAFSISNLALRVFSSRLARGISRDLLTGDASGNQPLGLLTALSNIGVPPVTAQGSVVNDGVTGHTGAVSLGSQDFANLLADLDSAYLDSPKAAFIMNRATLGSVNSVVDKQGQPARIVEYVDGKPFILGVPVKISPSMPNIGASQTPVILGDFSFWATRLVTAEDNVGLMVYREGPNLIEQGNIELASFTRAGGVLLYHDTGSPAPFAILQNHS